MTPRKRRGSFHEFPTTQQIEQATRDVVSAYERGGGAIAMIGGIAMQFYGSDRFTKDLDFIADHTAPVDDPSSVLRFSSRLSFGGGRYTTEDGVFVDIIVREDESALFYQDALDHAEPTDEGFLIVSPEYLAVMKFDADRGKDQIDLLWLLSQRDLVDVRKARRIVAQFWGTRLAKAFDAVVAEADWRNRKGEFRSKMDAEDTVRSEEE